MNLNKIWNSGLGIVLAVLAFLVAGRVISLVSWSLLRTCGYVFLGGVLVLAITSVRKNN